MSEVLFHCSRIEAVRNIEIFSDDKGDYAIVSYKKPLNKYLLMLEQSCPDKGIEGPNRVILQTEEYHIEVFQDDMYPNPEQNMEVERSSSAELNDDFFLNVFAYLNVADLANVAKCSKRFKYLAHRSFIQRRTLCFNRIHGDFLKEKRNIDYLVQFGATTEHLKLVFRKIPEVSFCEVSKIIRTIFNHINSNRLKSLTVQCSSNNKCVSFFIFFRMEFECLPQLQLLNIESSNPFVPFIETIPISDLDEWTPKLKKLKIYGVDFIMPRGNKNVLSSLEVLHIPNYNARSKNWDRIFFSNKCLREISVRESIGVPSIENFLQSLIANKIHQIVEKITFTQTSLLNINSFNRVAPLFTKLEYLEIGLVSLTSFKFVRSIRKLPALQTLVVHALSDPSLHETERDFSKMVGLNLPRLKKLTIKRFDVPQDESEMFRKELPICECMSLGCLPDQPWNGNISRDHGFGLSLFEVIFYTLLLAFLCYITDIFSLL